MTKLISIFLVLAMIVHLIRPLRIFGLNKRSDFWKIGIIAFGVWTVTLLLREAL